MSRIPMTDEQRAERFRAMGFNEEQVAAFVQQAHQFEQQGQQALRVAAMGMKDGQAMDGASIHSCP